MVCQFLKLISKRLCQISYSWVHKIDICLKYFSDKKSQKQPLCYKQDSVLEGALVGELALYVI